MEGWSRTVAAHEDVKQLRLVGVRSRLVPVEIGGLIRSLSPRWDQTLCQAAA